MQKSKIITFIGFAIRKRTLKAGVNAIKTIKHKTKLLIICKTASENTFKEAVKLAKNLSATLIVSNTYLVEDLVLKEHCKLIAIEDDGLADAILNNLDKDFTIYSGGSDNSYEREERN